MPILQVRKLSITQGHTVSKWWSQDLNPSRLEPAHSSTSSYCLETLWTPTPLAGGTIHAEKTSCVGLPWLLEQVCLVSEINKWQSPKCCNLHPGQELAGEPRRQVRLPLSITAPSGLCPGYPGPQKHWQSFSAVNQTPLSCTHCNCKVYIYGTIHTTVFDQHRLLYVLNEKYLNRLRSLNTRG